MADIDPVQFGELIGSVKSLTTTVENLQTDVTALTERMNTGKGFVFGLLIAAAGVGGSVGAVAHKILDLKG